MSGKYSSAVLVWQTKVVETSRRRRYKNDMPRGAASVQRCGDCISRVLAIGGLPHATGARRIGDACRAAAVVHHGIQAIALFLEARHQRTFKRAAARQLDAHRIDEPP